MDAVRPRGLLPGARDSGKGGAGVLIDIDIHVCLYVCGVCICICVCACVCVWACCCCCVRGVCAALPALNTIITIILLHLLQVLRLQHRFSEVSRSASQQVRALSLSVCVLCVTVYISPSTVGHRPKRIAHPLADLPRIPFNQHKIFLSKSKTGGRPGAGRRDGRFGVGGRG